MNIQFMQLFIYMYNNNQFFKIMDESNIKIYQEFTIFIAYI